MRKEELDSIVEELTNDKNKEKEITPRDLFSAFDFQRRTWRNCEIVDAYLTDKNMELRPGYNDVWIDNPVILHHKKVASSYVQNPIKCVRVLKSATTAPKCVSFNDKLSKATTIMQMHNYSQLPVLKGSSEIYGYISWKSIGTAQVNGVDSDMVKDYVDRNITKLELDCPLMNAIEYVCKNDFAVVVDQTKKPCGIITTADITSQFISNTSPFVYIEQIESQLRLLMKGAFLLEEIQKVCTEDKRAATITSIDDLTFGEYIRLIENEEQWKHLDLCSVDRTMFIKRMDEVREIRNDVMHFEPAGITSEQTDLLHETSDFLSMLINQREKRECIKAKNRSCLEQ